MKLLAEPWDCGGLYQVGSFPNWDVWGEWNGRFRDDVRRFVKGDPGTKAAFATRLAGSADLYNVNQRCSTGSCDSLVQNRPPWRPCIRSSGSARRIKCHEVCMQSYI